MSTRALEPPDSTSPPSPGRFPVVVVEDDAAIRTFATRSLTARGHRVTALASVEAALEALKELQTPILVVDKNLPGAEGLDLVQTLRSAKQDFEAILMTAHADVDSLTRSIKLGVYRCIHKPFRGEDLVDAVGGAANRLMLRIDLRARRLEVEERNAALEANLAELRDERQLRLRNERLASVGRLAAGVAHEINSPLTAVIANLALVSEELTRAEPPDVPALLEMVADAREAAERVRTVVRDLKSFSRADDESLGPVDVKRTIESSVNIVYNEIRHCARLVKDLEETREVLGNEARLGQVVVNLLLNAAQAIPSGAVHRNQIRIVCREAGERVVVEVQDTGTGMSAEVCERIFEPFFTTKPVGVGTGLGMAICHGIVTGYGGDIRVRSEPGKGTTVTVSLPVATALAHSAPGVATSQSWGPRARVLAIDDDASVLRALKRLLGRSHDVVAVPGAREALQRLASGEAYDVVLCDVMMPEMTGIDFHEELTRTAPSVADAVVFMTGGTFTRRAQEFLDRVPNLRLVKPFDPSQLRAVIHERMRSLAGAASA
jgi:signal transduction histidine kinase